MRKHEGGFTLIELLAAMAITSVLLTLGAFAVRNFWLVRSLTGGQDEIVNQLRAVQSKGMAESNPLVLGVGFREGTNQWQIVRLNTTTNACTGDGTRRFDAGVVVSDVTFTTTVSGVNTATFVSECKSDLTTLASYPNDGFVFFLPRGTATSGTVTIRQPNLDRTASVRVNSLSGRVEEQ